MNETVWAEFLRRFPWAAGLAPEKLDEAIAENWPSMDRGDLAHMFKRMAMHCALEAEPKWPNQ